MHQWIIKKDSLLPCNPNHVVLVPIIYMCAFFDDLFLSPNSWISSSVDSTMALQSLLSINETENDIEQWKKDFVTIIIMIVHVYIHTIYDKRQTTNHQWEWRCLFHIFQSLFTLFSSLFCSVDYCRCVTVAFVMHCLLVELENITNTERTNIHIKHERKKIKSQKIQKTKIMTTMTKVVSCLLSLFPCRFGIWGLFRLLYKFVSHISIYTFLMRVWQVLWPVLQSKAKHVFVTQKCCAVIGSHGLTNDKMAFYC